MASLEGWELEDIPLSQIKTDLPGLDKEKVKQYKAMDFSKVPAIVGYWGKDKRYYILDGYHRASVAKALGKPTVRAYTGMAT